MAVFSKVIQRRTGPVVHLAASNERHFTRMVHPTPEEAARLAEEGERIQGKPFRNALEKQLFFQRERENERITDAMLFGTSEFFKANPMLRETIGKGAINFLTSLAPTAVAGGRSFGRVLDLFGADDTARYFLENADELEALSRRVAEAAAPKTFAGETAITLGGLAAILPAFKERLVTEAVDALGQWIASDGEDTEALKNVFHTGMFLGSAKLVGLGLNKAIGKKAAERFGKEWEKRWFSAIPRAVEATAFAGTGAAFAAFEKGMSGEGEIVSGSTLGEAIFGALSGGKSDRPLGRFLHTKYYTDKILSVRGLKNAVDNIETSRNQNIDSVRQNVDNKLAEHAALRDRAGNQLNILVNPKDVSERPVLSDGTTVLDLRSFREQLALTRNLGEMETVKKLNLEGVPDKMRPEVGKILDAFVKSEASMRTGLAKNIKRSIQMDLDGGMKLEDSIARHEKVLGDFMPERKKVAPETEKVAEPGKPEPPPAPKDIFTPERAPGKPAITAKETASKVEKSVEKPSEKKKKQRSRDPQPPSFQNLVEGKLTKKQKSDLSIEVRKKLQGKKRVTEEDVEGALIEVINEKAKKGEAFTDRPEVEIGKGPDELGRINVLRDPTDTTGEFKTIPRRGQATESGSIGSRIAEQRRKDIGIQTGSELTQTDPLPRRALIDIRDKINTGKLERKVTLGIARVRGKELAQKHDIRGFEKFLEFADRDPVLKEMSENSLRKVWDAMVKKDPSLFLTERQIAERGKSQELRGKRFDTPANFKAVKSLVERIRKDGTDPDSSEGVRKFNDQAAKDKDLKNIPSGELKRLYARSVGAGKLRRQEFFKPGFRGKEERRSREEADRTGEGAAGDGEHLGKTRAELREAVAGEKEKPQFSEVERGRLIEEMPDHLKDRVRSGELTVEQARDAEILEILGKSDTSRSTTDLNAKIEESILVRQELYDRNKWIEGQKRAEEGLRLLDLESPGAVEAAQRETITSVRDALPEGSRERRLADLLLEGRTFEELAMLPDFRTSPAESAKLMADVQNLHRSVLEKLADHPVVKRAAETSTRERLEQVNDQIDDTNMRRGKNGEEVPIDGVRMELSNGAEIQAVHVVDIIVTRNGTPQLTVKEKNGNHHKVEFESVAEADRKLSEMKKPGEIPEVGVLASEGSARYVPEGGRRLRLKDGESGAVLGDLLLPNGRVVKHLFTVASSLVKRGFNEFKSWAHVMISTFGREVAEIRDYLPGVWARLWNARVDRLRERLKVTAERSSLFAKDDVAIIERAKASAAVKAGRFKPGQISEANVRVKVADGWRGYLTQARHIIVTSGRRVWERHGPEAARMADKMIQTIGDGERLAAAFKSSSGTWRMLSDLTPAERKAIGERLRNDPNPQFPMTPKAEAFVESLRRGFDDAFQVAHNLGIKVRTFGGGERDIHQVRDFFPQIADRTILTTREGFNAEAKHLIESGQIDWYLQDIFGGGKKKFSKAQIDKKLEEMGKTRQEIAEGVVKAWMEGGMDLIFSPQVEVHLNRGFAGIRRARSLEFARRFKFLNVEKDAGLVAREYFDGLGRRAKIVETFGQNGEVGFDFINKVKEAGGDSDSMRRIYENFIGYGEKETVMVDIAREMASWVALMRLGLSAVSNVSQGFVNSWIYSESLESSLEGVRRGLMDHKNAREFAEISGAILGKSHRDMLKDFMGNWTETRAGGKAPTLSAKMLNLMMKYNGFKFTEDLNRIIASNAGEHWVTNRLVPDLFFGSLLRERNARQRLKDLGLDPQAIKERGHVTREEVLSAAWRFSRETQFASDPLSLPLIAQSGAYGVFVRQFKTFSFSQAKLLKDMMKRSPFKTAARLAALTMTVGVLQDDIKAFVRGRLDGDEHWTDALLLNYMAIGGFGLVTDVIEGGTYGQENFVGLFAGPVWEEAWSLSEDAYDGYMSESWQPWQEAVVDRIPVAGPALESMIFKRKHGDIFARRNRATTMGKVIRALGPEPEDD